MALIDSMLNLVNKKAKDPDAPKPPPGSRSEREAKIKDKAGMVINIFALLLAVNTYFGNGFSSTIMNNTIKANDTWSFYQAKSIKQTVIENAAEEAEARGDKSKAEMHRQTAARYESEPQTGEGKKELMAKARSLEAERTTAKARSPWYTYAGSLFQIAIVLLTASILAVNMRLYYSSVVVGSFAAFLMSQAVWLWLPLTL